MNYFIALGVYLALIVMLRLYILLTNHYQNHGTTQENPINRRENNSEVAEFEGLYIPRSNPTIPPPNEYEAYSIEEYAGDVYEMPFELWIAQLEHDTFIEYMRENLEQGGILMNDINR